MFCLGLKCQVVKLAQVLRHSQKLQITYFWYHLLVSISLIDQISVFWLLMPCLTHVSECWEAKKSRTPRSSARYTDPCTFRYLYLPTWTFNGRWYTISNFQAEMSAPKNEGSKSWKRRVGNLKEKCLICSDKASSHSHYGTVKICFSCRAFFRRIVRQKKTPDQKNCNRVSNTLGNCPITIKTRHLCW